jgi:hypothetical protein
MYAILWVAFLDPSDSYFLFADLFGFYTQIIDVHPLWKPTLYIIIPYIFVLLYKSNKKFFGKYTDEGDNLVDNPKIYNVEGDNRLLFGLQILTTGSVLLIVVQMDTLRGDISFRYLKQFFLVIYEMRSKISM